MGPAPHFDLPAVMTADTDEWEDTDSIAAQGTIDTPYEDTGVVIVNKPVELGPPGQTDRFVVTFRKPTAVAFRAPLPPTPAARATTADDWPPAPREPAQAAPQIRERAFKRAAVYTIVPRPETNKN